jgi:hypothetical protein
MEPSRTAPARVPRKVSERTAKDALNAQLAKSHREAMDLFTQQMDAVAELESLMTGPRRSLFSGRTAHYSTLLQTASALENAAFNVENALLNNDFESWGYYPETEPVNIPKQCARGIVLEAEKPEKNEVRAAEGKIACGF